ncbi:MAG: hypothetical protein ACRDBO_15775 [Lachnospiraceae bacterium]
MTNFERLEQSIHEKGIKLDIVDFESPRIKGLYIDGSIALSKDLHTTAEKACIAAEELAHSELTVGNILDVSDTQNRKQEYIARLRTYDKMIGLIGIVQGYRARCCNLYELAQHLEVTEGFLQEALDCYRSKYGLMIGVDNYIIFFEPSLSVYEKL